ncbi:hypothetical protein KW790_03395 [Candidatus Parcubacteria bacterium]|nr:hypothetical protein [Candidatus Parcubacteria bacterium]
MQSDVLGKYRYVPTCWDPETVAKELADLAKSEGHDAYAYIGNIIMWATPGSIPAELVATYNIERLSREEWRAERRQNPDRRNKSKATNKSKTTDDAPKTERRKRDRRTVKLPQEAPLPSELSA